MGGCQSIIRTRSLFLVRRVELHDDLGVPEIFYAIQRGIGFSVVGDTGCNCARIHTPNIINLPQPINVLYQYSIRVDNTAKLLVFHHEPIRASDSAIG